MSQLAAIYDAAVTTGANMLASPIRAPRGSGKTVRVWSFVKAGATASALLAHLTPPGVGAATLIATLRNGETNEVQDVAHVYTYEVDLPPGFSLNFRPGTNTTWGVLVVSDD